MIRRRRFKRRGVWAWADKGCVQIQGNNSSLPSTAIVNLYPSGITENRFRGRCRVRRIILWLKCNYVNGTLNGQNIPEGSLYIIRRNRNQQEATQTLSYDPFGTPQVPSTITTWSNDDSGGGLDSYLWSYRLYADAPANTGAAGLAQDSCLGFSPSISNDAAYQYLPTRVSGWLQPHLDLKTSRGMRNGDELMLGVNLDRALAGVPGSGAYELFTLYYAVRIVCT